MTLAAVLCCAMTTTVFTACGSDDDSGTSKSEDTTPVAAVMEYSFTSSDAMLATFDLTIEYYDANGRVQTEPMTQNTWTKKVTAKLPATLGARLKVQVKAGIDTSTAETIPVAWGYQYMGYAVSATDKVVSNVVTKGNSKAYDMEGDKLSEWLDFYADGLVKYLFVFDTKGQVTEGSWQ